MPTIHVPVKLFHQGIGKTLNLEQLEELCFEFGIEVDLIENEPKEPNKYAFETPSNRNDLLCTEGIIRNLNIYLGFVPIPSFTPFNPSKNLERIVVKKDVFNDYF